MQNLALALLVGVFCWLQSPVQAAEIQPDAENPVDYFRAGVTAFQTADYADAIEQFSVAIQLDPNYSAAYGDRCLTYLELAHYQQAIADCSTALELKPNYAEAYLNRGLALYRDGQYDAAIADYSHLLQIKPHDPRAYYNRGLARVEQAAYREALVDYGEALRQVSPLDQAAIALIHNDRGIVHGLLDQPQAAIANFTQAIQANPQDVRALFNRGCAYHHQGNLMAALDDFTQVTVLDAQYAEAYLNAGLIHQALGDPVKAIAELQQAAASFQSQGLLLPYQQTMGLLERMRSTSLALG